MASLGVRRRRTEDGRRKTNLGHRSFVLGRISFPLVCIVLLLLGPLLACGWLDGPSEATPTPPLPSVDSPTAVSLPIPLGEPAPLPPAVPWPTAAYIPIPLPDLSPPPAQLDLATAVNLANLPLLSQAELEHLAQTGRVVLEQPSADWLGSWQFAAEHNLPLYVNSELVLRATQIATQRAWARVQREYLPHQLLVLTAAHSATAENQWRNAADPLVQTAAEHSLAYFGVAGRLLNPAYSVHPAAAELVASELALIAQGGTFVSPLMGGVVGYQPLAEAETGYGKALAWYQHMPLQLDPALPTAQRHAQQARLWLAQPPATADLWLQFAAGLAYTSGAQGATLPHWQAIAHATADESLDQFWLMAAQLPQPTFYFLPPPSSPTAEIFHALTYNRVGAYTGSGPLPTVARETAVGAIRLLPNGLDVAAAVGSEPALAMLQASGAADFVGWEVQIGALRHQFGHADAQAWTHAASGGWLYALSPMLDTPAWQVGWETEAAVWPPIPSATATQLPDVGLVIVAPQAELYGRLAAHQRQLLATWQAAGWLSEGNAAELLLLDELLRWLFVLAVRQQAAEAFTAEEQAWALAIPQRLAHLLGDVSLPRTGVLHTDVLTGEVVTAVWPEARPRLILTTWEGQVVVAVE